MRGISDLWKLFQGVVAQIEMLQVGQLANAGRQGSNGIVRQRQPLQVHKLPYTIWQTRQPVASSKLHQKHSKYRVTDIEQAVALSWRI